MREQPSGLFEDEEDFTKFLDLLFHYKEKFQFKRYHYFLMTNHVHLVIEPSERGVDLSYVLPGVRSAVVSSVAMDQDAIPSDFNDVLTTRWVMSSFHNPLPVSALWVEKIR